jgi:ABC-type phosphate transport system ATPase subunit
VKTRPDAPSLFDNDPVFRFRDSKGRYATAEKYYFDKTAKENIMLRYDREKYMRALIGAGKTNSYLLRENKRLKEIIEEIKSKL